MRPLPVGYVKSFVEGYVACALWSTSDESTASGGVPFDENYGPEDIEPNTLVTMKRDCVDFIRENRYELAKAMHIHPGLRPSYDGKNAGHDFWLTRCGHGAGFWDRGLWEVGKRLTKAAKVYGDFTLIAGDDGMIHGW